jgi:hypothetical protein
MRFRNQSWVWAWAIGIVATGFAAPARAASSAPVTVVEVSSGAAELGAEQLRALIATELGCTVVAPGDPRAATAQGTLTVDLDREHAELSVTYLAHSAPLQRHVALPRTVSEAQRAAVLLSGNLARDEAMGLAAELRQEHASPPSPTPSATPNPKTLDDSSDASQVALAQRQEAARLQATLEFYAGNDRNSRRAAGWAALATGALGVGASAYIASQSKQELWLLAGSEGLLIMGAGGLSLLSPSAFEGIAEYGRKAAASPGATERAWLTAAHAERSRRKVAGVVALTAGILSAGFGTFLLFDSPSSNNDANRYGPSLIFMALGGIDGIAGAYAFATEGPVESGLHAYERSSGRVLDGAHSSVPKLQFGMTPSGFMAGLSGTF